MTVRLLVHIGINKTGSGAIQHFFVRNRETFRHRGILYPTPPSPAAAHHYLSRLLGFGPGLDIDPKTRKAELEKLKKGLQKDVRKAKAHTIVLSSEFFMLPRPIDPVVAYLADFDVRIVVYLRRHDSWRESAYNQGLKTVSNPPWGLGFESWLAYQQDKNPRYGDYRLLVDRWSEAFGRENLIVRPYEKQQNQPDIITDFIRSCSLDVTLNPRLLTSDRVNEALSPTAMALLDIIQHANIAENVRAALVRYARSMPPPTDRISVVSPSLRHRLATEREDDYTYIARNFLGREDGRLFFDPVPDPAAHWEPPNPLTQVEIAEHLAQALAGT